MSFYKDMGIMDDRDKSIHDLGGVDSSYLISLLGTTPPDEKREHMTCEICFRSFYMPVGTVRCNSLCRDALQSSPEDIEFKAAREMLDKELGIRVLDVEIEEFMKAMKRDEELPEDTPWQHGGRVVFQKWLVKTGYYWSYKGKGL